MKARFTDRELDVMAVLWDRGPSTAAQVRERLADPLAHNTVLTVLCVLEDKGYVARAVAGRTHLFRALVKREIAGATAAARVIEKLFGGSPERLVTHLVGERGITADELRRLRRLMDKRLQEMGE